MTHDERISAYIDNEFTVEQEQEFLISLAASEGLRKSFRSELVLKKILHRDEARVTPPRRLRSTIFAGLGLGAGIVASSKAEASSSSQSALSQSASIASRGLLKTIFATKFSTLLTVAGLSSAALVGYGVRSVTAPAPEASVMVPVTTVHSPVGAIAEPKQTLPVPPTVNPSLSSAEVSSAATTAPVVHSAKHHRSATPAHASAVQPSVPINSTVGGGPVTLEPPTIGH